MSNPIKKLARQTAIYGLSTIIVRLIHLVLLPYHTRILSEADFGIITELYAYVAFLNILFMYGMETAFFRFASKFKEKDTVFSTAWFSLLISTFIFVGILILFSSKWAMLIGYPQKTDLVIWFTLIIGLDALSNLPFAKLRLDSKPYTYVIIKIINVSLNVGLNVFFFLPLILNNYTLFSNIGFTYSPKFGIGYIIVANLIASALTFVLLLPTFIRAPIRVNWKLLPKLYKYAYPFVIIGFAAMINEVSDRILLKKLLHGTIVDRNSQVGIYSAAYKLGLFMTLAIQSFRMGAEPFFFKQAKEKNARQVYARIMLYFCITCLVIFLVISLYIDIFKHIIGAHFREGIHIVPIILFANLFLGIYYNLSIWYKLTDKTYLGIYIAVVGAGITIMSNYILVPHIGYTGAAVSTLICYMSMSIISFIWGRKHYEVDYNVSKIIAYMIFSIILYTIHLYLKNHVVHNWALYAANGVLLCIFIITAYQIDLKKVFGNEQKSIL